MKSLDLTSSGDSLLLVFYSDSRGARRPEGALRVMVTNAGEMVQNRFIAILISQEVYV